MIRNFALILFLSTGVHSLETSLLEQHHNVQYWTYTKENRNQPLHIRDVTFNDGQTTTFIIHGYSPSSLDQPLKLVNDIFDHDRNVSRVIVVSWIDYASDASTTNYEYNIPGYYKVSTQHVPIMAADVNEKLMYVRSKGSRRIELIGHCIGAHVAAQAGKLFRTTTGDAVDKIIGLDPTGLYWSTHLNEALQPGIAKELTILHTNMDRYGFPTTIGPNDILVNGGKKLPNCKSKLTEDICSHNGAWQAYSNFLKDNGSVPLIEMTDNRPYVLCMDISESMRNNGRLAIAVDAAKQLISNMINGTNVGIVTFNRNAVVAHDIVRIDGSSEKNSLIAAFPKIAEGSTSIGAGLRVSMELINSFISDDDELCSTIILISDGEQTVGETPYDVLPELQRSCITINSIGLGLDASQDLENISAETAGQVYYVIEGDKSVQMADTIRALVYAYESDLDDDDRSIHLPTYEIDLTTGDTVVPIEIEENIGKDTEIDLMTDDIDDVDMSLTSPDGHEYTDESPEFSSSLMTKFLNIGLLEPGHYNLTVNKKQKSRRSVRSSSKAVVMVKTHELSKMYPVVRLDASVSSRVLVHPKPVIISAELRVDQFPVIHADVFANIKGLNQETIRVQLTDTGVFPDILADDGVYTASIANLPKPERYSVTVTAASNGTAKIVTKKVDYLLKLTSNCRWPTCRRLRLRPFQRETDVGSIKTLSKFTDDLLPPSSVNDLRAIVPYDERKLVILEWSCPTVVQNAEIQSYDIRVLIGNEKFDDAIQFYDENFVNGKSNARNCTDGKTEKFYINIPDHIWTLKKENVVNGTFDLRFALKVIGVNNMKSEESNVAVATFKKRCVTVYRRTRVGIIRIVLC